MLLTGLIGRPVSHSIGQTVYNRFYSSSGIESMYLSIDVMTENLERFVKLSKENFSGYNVTIPHKVQIMNYLDSMDPAASEIGAVNLVRNCDGKSRGYNTDYLAMEKLGSGRGLNFENSSIAVAGTGGVSRTVLYYMARRHPEAEVTIFSRNPDAAAVKLPSYVLEKGYEILSTKEMSQRDSFDILINCSPSGMWPETGESPFIESAILNCQAGIDLVYNPVDTLFIKRLRELGKKA
ncbi:MAG TPA: shikimate dehydrogenase, partial [Thermoplasmataceae archaeon]|nr:shikimate dehydrogenase [Thermoplasmataceae archaeon]